MPNIVTSSSSLNVTWSNTIDTSSSELPQNVTWSDNFLFKWHGTEIIVIPIMMFLGILGNLLVFYIYHFRWRSDTVTLVKRMLAGLDLASLGLAMPIVLYLTIYPRSSSFIPLCQFSSFVAISSAATSGLVLLIIAVDRFLKLCLLRKHGISSKFSKQLFVASFMFSIIINLPTFWLFGRESIDFYHYNILASHCFIDSNKNDNLFYLWSFVVLITFMVIMTVLVYLYKKIIVTLRDLSKKHDELTRRPSVAVGSELLQREKQSQIMRTTAKVFIAITLVYFCSYAPYFISLLLSMIDPTIQGSMGPSVKAFYDLCKLSPLANNVANPFIYSFTSDRFCAEVKKMLTLKSCQKGGVFRRRAYSTTSRACDQEVSQVSETTS